MSTQRKAYTMRKTLFTLLPASLLCLLLLAFGTTPSESAPTAPATATPSATPTLPVCAEEDGAGMAECTYQGIVSGDCAPDIMPDDATYNQCMLLHHEGQDGPNAVQECNDIENRINAGLDTREKGFTLYNCFRAMRGM